MAAFTWRRLTHYQEHRRTEEQFHEAVVGRPATDELSGASGVIDILNGNTPEEAQRNRRPVVAKGVVQQLADCTQALATLTASHEDLKARVTTLERRPRASSKK